MITTSWNGFWLRMFCIGLITTGGCLSQTEHSSNSPEFMDCAQRDFAALPQRILADSKYTLSQPNNVIALSLAAGASIAMHNTAADDNIAGNFERHDTFKGFSDESLNVIGCPLTHFAATGLWYVLSSENQDQFNKERAMTMITALSTTGLTTIALKAIRNNKTPNGKKWAWPSGHTSSSFTAASVLHEFYGPQVGIPAYVLSSLVAWRMMDTGDHWASDVVFGATLGWVVGHSIAGKHKQMEIAGFKVIPYTAAGMTNSLMGVNFVKTF